MVLSLCIETAQSKLLGEAKLTLKIGNHGIKNGYTLLPLHTFWLLSQICYRVLRLNPWAIYLSGAFATGLIW